MTEDRKMRTRRLIEIGAIIETYFGITTAAEAKALGKIANSDPIKFQKLKNRIEETKNELS